MVGLTYAAIYCSDVILSPRNRSFADWPKLRDNLITAGRTFAWVPPSLKTSTGPTVTHVFRCHFCANRSTTLTRADTTSVE
jgi:hypothetical protein